MAGPALATPVSTSSDGPVVGARRNIALDFDEEEKAWEGGGRAEVGASEAIRDASNEETKRESSSESKSINGCGGDDGRGESSTPSSPAVNASLPQPTRNGEDNLEELAMLEASSVAELHEVRSTAWSFRPLVDRGGLSLPIACPARSCAIVGRVRVRVPACLQSRREGLSPPRARWSHPLSVFCSIAVIAGSARGTARAGG